MLLVIRIELWGVSSMFWMGLSRSNNFVVSLLLLTIFVYFRVDLCVKWSVPKLRFVKNKELVLVFSQYHRSTRVTMRAWSIFGVAFSRGFCFSSLVRCDSVQCSQGGTATVVSICETFKVSFNSLNQCETFRKANLPESDHLQQRYNCAALFALLCRGS